MLIERENILPTLVIVALGLAMAWAFMRAM
jgi:hypothetical protein